MQDEPQPITASESTNRVSDASTLAKTAHLESQMNELQEKLHQAESKTRTQLEELVQTTARSH